MQRCSSSGIQERPSTRAWGHTTARSRYVRGALYCYYTVAVVVTLESVSFLSLVRPARVSGTSLTLCAQQQILHYDC